MKIKVSLNSASIDDAIKQLEAYQQKVDKLGDRIVHRLTESGSEQAKEMAMYMNAYDSGELVNGIIPEYRDKNGYIVSTAPHSAFVEMGTGVVGAQNPNPNNSVPGWVYDVNGHGEAGWVYFKEKDGKYHWTKGIPSRPYMYDTAQILRDSIPDVAKEELEK